MNRSYSKIRHIKESNMQLEQKFLNEGQSFINGGKVGRVSETFTNIDPVKDQIKLADMLDKRYNQYIDFGKK